jgi:hypothetical protein
MIVVLEDWFIPVFLSKNLCRILPTGRYLLWRGNPLKNYSQSCKNLDKKQGLLSGFNPYKK